MSISNLPVLKAPQKLELEISEDWRERTSSDEMCHSEGKNVLITFLATKNLQIGKEIGRGQFASVYELIGSKSTRAIKILHKAPRKLQEMNLFRLKRGESLNPNPEVKFIYWRGLKGLQIGRPREVDTRIEAIVMPLMDTDLEKFITNAPPLSIRKSLKLVLQIAHELRALHAKRIAHRDLKPANILMKGEKVCLGDFGISRKYEESEDKLETPIGSIMYMAPERGAEVEDPFKCDVYSLGCVAYFITYQIHPPFFFNFPKLDCHEVMRTLLAQTCEVDPHKRISLDMLILWVEQQRSLLALKARERRQSLQKTDQMFPLIKQIALTPSSFKELSEKTGLTPDVEFKLPSISMSPIFLAQSDQNAESKVPSFDLNGVDQSF